MKSHLGQDAIRDEAEELSCLEDEALLRARDDWRASFVIPNRFPGSSNTLFVRKVRMVQALDAELARRGLIDERPKRG